MSLLLLALATAAAIAQSPSTGPSGERRHRPVHSGRPSVTVQAYEYAYRGLPSSVPVASSLAMVNEVDELAVFRRNQGTTQSWEELLALPDDQALAFVTPIDASFALPGQSADHAVVLPQEGDYIAVCFVPQGLTSIPTDGGASPAASGALDPSEAPASAPASGPPHFTLGIGSRSRSLPPAPRRARCPAAPRPGAPLLAPGGLSRRLTPRRRASLHGPRRHGHATSLCAAMSQP
jgi:hypothetical protein